MTLWRTKNISRPLLCRWFKQEISRTKGAILLVRYSLEELSINKIKTLCQIICSLKFLCLIQPVASNNLILTTVLGLPSSFPGVFSCEDEIAHCQIFTFSHLTNATRDKFYLICLLFYVMNSLQLKGIIRTKIVLCLKLDTIWEWNIGHL